MFGFPRPWMYSRKLYRCADNGAQIQQSSTPAKAARRNHSLDLGAQFLKILSFSALGMEGNRRYSSAKNHQLWNPESGASFSNSVLALQ